MITRNQKHSQTRILDVSPRDLSLSFPAGEVLDQRLAAGMHHVTQSIQAFVTHVEVVTHVKEYA